MTNLSLIEIKLYWGNRYYKTNKTSSDGILKQNQRIHTNQHVKMQVASISSFLHRPGQVQYLQVQSIATDPHLCKKGYSTYAYMKTRTTKTCIKAMRDTSFILPLYWSEAINLVSFAWICTAHSWSWMQTSKTNHVMNKLKRDLLWTLWRADAVKLVVLQVLTLQ